MTQLLGLSFDAVASPSLELKIESEGSSPPPSAGWGLAWYPESDLAAAVLKDPTAVGWRAISRVLAEWKRFRSTLFLCHVLGAAKRRTQQDTHPFVRTLGGRSWLFAHNGDLEGDLSGHLPLGDDPAYEPIGRTDSEHVFSWLLGTFRARGIRRLSDVGWPELLGLFGRMNERGTMNALLADGQHLVAYRDAKGFRSLHVLRRKPPHASTRLGNETFSIEIGNALDLSRTIVLFSTAPLSDEPWEALEPGRMIVAARGAIVWDSKGMAEPSSGPPIIGVLSPALEALQALEPPPPAPPPRQMRPALAASRQGRSGEDPAPRADGRTLKVLHRTVYRYEKPVEFSKHVFRLRPVHDETQEIVSHALEIAPRGIRIDYDDVFANRATRLDLEEPYGELRIESASVVKLHPLPPVTNAQFYERLTIPLVWMPWQREMMHPYLLPVELPETQLRELSEFAMSFVERQDFDLVESLADLNRTIYKDFAYVPKSTGLETTPFDVYTNRRGVCQDFANLFICLSRLLGVPARYRVGYIYTGAEYGNKIQSEASHAWVEVYLPWTGWRGFDPTNGCQAGPDHVRVAAGRNYRDATPTSGTIYRGGGGEKLEIEVRVEEA